MAGLAEKVKDSLRSRSRHRYSVRNREGDSSDDSTPKRSKSKAQEPSTNNDDHPPLPSPVTSAWHIHRGTPTPSATPSEHRSFSGDTTSPSTTRNKSHRSHGSLPGSVPVDVSQSRTLNRQEQRYSLPPHSQPLYIPERKDSLPSNRRPVPTANTPPLPITNMTHDTKTLPVRTDRHAMDITHHETSAGRERDLGQLRQQGNVDTSPGQMRTHEPAPARVQNEDQLMASVLDKVEHLRLPSDFDLGNSEKTVVDVEWKPAVTHENIYHHQTEIIQEAITRDVHVHHYYTYVQPIRVVEVLAPKHYRINDSTGEKYEIPSPAGWVMPTDMQPRPVDTSMLKATTRHYLVNEQHPHGVEEPPPLDFDDHVDLLEPTEYGVWTM